MKSYCKGYQVGPAEVAAALDDWAHHDSGRKNRWRVEAEFGSGDALVSEIASEVRSRSLSLAPMRSYERHDGASGKVRTITVESVKQQVCDYVAVRALQPMLDDRLGFWQYGSVHVRSSLELARAVKRWQHTCSWWVHLDVAKCYQSTSTDMLRRMLARYVRSADVLYLLDRLLAAHGGGLALGSYLSLRLSQWVLSYGYHHVEDMHKSRRGRAVSLASRQGWYADDIWLMGTRKRDVQAAARELERYLGHEFGLALHPWQVCRVGDDEPMDVAGWVVRPGRITLRDVSFLRADRALRRFRAEPTEGRARTLVSYKSQLAHSDSDKYITGHDLRGAMRSAQATISRGTRGEGRSDEPQG